MSEFILYLAKPSLVLALLYGLYYALLRSVTYHHFNRVYILAALVISMIVPLLNVQLLQPAAQVQNHFSYVNEAFLTINDSLEKVQETAVVRVRSVPVFSYILIAGMVLMALRLGYQLYSIYQKIIKHEIKRKGNYKYVLIDQHHSTHSFFNYIFVQKSEYKKQRIRNVLLHEQMHAQQWHSIDLLLIGFLSVLLWFNPFIYLFKRALVETHEFQADQAVIKKGVDRHLYQRLLLEHARSIVMTGLTSSFNQSIIKNRLKMMNKIESKKSAIIRYLMVLPIATSACIFMMCSNDKIDEVLEESAKPLSSVTNALRYADGKLWFPYLDDQIEFSARDSISGNGKLMVLYGDAKVNSSRSELRSDIVYIDKTDKEVFVFTEHNVPSIYPIDKKFLKRPPSGFGMRMHPILKIRRMHNGMDFALDHGSKIFATANGIVRSAELVGPYGNRVIIDHGNSISTSYNHMSEFSVEAGLSVDKGELIGYVGNTGLSARPHLHYEIMKDGKYVDPADYLGE
jgi:hypothetical protein